MDERRPADFEIEDFVANDSFLNYYLHGNTKDKEFWDLWLLNNPGKKDMAKAAMEMIDLLLLRLPENEYRQELEKIGRKLSTAVPLQKKTSSFISFLHWNKAAFTKKFKRKNTMVYLLPIVLLIAAGGYFFMQRSYRQNDGLVEKHNAGSTALQLILSDSTLVILAPNSTLRYNKQFGNIERKVYLDGEAGFHVKRDEVHPFKVYANELVATVLGTVFNIKEQGDSAVLVELISGKVKVETDDNTGSIILNPKERVLYTRKDHRMYKEAMLLQEEVVTQQNHIVFRRNNFEEIALKIKTVFGVTVINQSNKNNWRFTGEFNNITAKDIIENICLVEHLNYELKGDSILIK